MLHFLDTCPSRAEFLHLQPGAGWLDGDVGKVNLVATGPGQTMTRYWPLQWSGSLSADLLSSYLP